MNGRKSIRKLLTFLAGIVLLSASWAAPAAKDPHGANPVGADNYLPNYADRLLSPVDGTNIAPRLVAARKRFPIRVAIIDDGELFRERWYDVVRAACESWASATHDVPGGGLEFQYARSSSPLGADIVIQFVGAHGYHGFGGFSSEFGDWALVSVAVLDTRGADETNAYVRRVTMHELGHALGIWGHSPNPKDIMSENEQATEITLADVNTLRLAYRTGE